MTRRFLERCSVARAFCLAFLMAGAMGPAALAAPREPTPDDDFISSEVMIPMRDGVKLHTIVLIPKESAEPMPILLSRTPYGADSRLKVKQVTQLQGVLGAAFAELHGYIFVIQDVRGRNGSEGEFVVFRPFRGPFNSTQTDETTDAWDTVDWLVKNVTSNNGRVGIYGTSYDGWTTLAALLDPHPALKVAVPVNPAVNLWMGDDWFHNGAFRLPYVMEYVYAMESNPTAWTPFPISVADTYTWWLNAGSAIDVGTRYLDEKRHKYWQVVTTRPTYDAYWQDAALDKRLAKSTSRLVPTMHVMGLFDQEDIYGAAAAYSAMESRDVGNDSNFLVAGPWCHGQNWRVGDQLGPVRWDVDTARGWREEILVPFLAHYLKNAPQSKLAPAVIFNTGIRRWERFSTWPQPSGTSTRRLYLHSPGQLDWHVPTARRASDSFVSDPWKPVPYQPRPVRRLYDDELGNAAWRAWLTVDQRFADGRPDVLTYMSPVLSAAITVRGAITADLFAETTGTDADWIVKLIDVFPEQDASEPSMGGYQLMISGNVLRGRYREGFEKPRAIQANKPLEYRFSLPQVNHTFEPGHRIMVQVQSTWFPLYDRNPQQFVPSIMEAKATDYRLATHRIHTSSQLPSALELQVDEK